MKEQGSKLTLAAEEGGQLPELGHVEGLEDLTLVASAVAVEDDGGVVTAGVLVSEGEASADGDLSTDNAVAAEETLGEHVHGAALAVGDTLAAAQQLADDRSHGSASHQSEAVAPVGSDNIVVLVDSMLNTDGDSFLPRGKVAETPNLLFLV